MKIQLQDDKTIVYDDENKILEEFNLGHLDILKYSFPVVDHLVEYIVPMIDMKEKVYVLGDNLESKMIARKIEDRIKRPVDIVI